ncbi:hypothetical protein DPMN_135869 [Dreissena polymorpha]|uniref:Uncharacterized protein n=1 Tax=Dreissena polymorpha TaxID=45954 RepID=A0A9D4G2R6_DREPO|nr:hypothetical protein DPMN_135869 [Dreissena polymorpha]
MICKKNCDNGKNEQINPKSPTFGGKRKYWNDQYSKQAGQSHSKSDKKPRYLARTAPPNQTTLL